MHTNGIYRYTQLVYTQKWHTYTQMEYWKEIVMHVGDYRLLFVSSYAALNQKMNISLIVVQLFGVLHISVSFIMFSNALKVYTKMEYHKVTAVNILGCSLSFVCQIQL